jgi:hypothetical protein
MKTIITIITLILFLSGCVREESPLWYMASNDEEIRIHFKEVCLDYGYKLNTPEINRCIREERKLSSAAANNALFRAGQQMERMGTPLMYRQY